MIVAIVCHFKKSFGEFQKTFEAKFGFMLFMPLASDDAHVMKTMRVPLNNEVGEFEQQIANLAKILPDSINTKKIRQSGDITVPKKERGKQNFVLRCFLEHHSLDTHIVDILEMIQEIRSAGVAHRKGQRYTSVIKKYKFEEIAYVDLSS